MQRSSHDTIKRHSDDFYVSLLRNGDETGLEHIYNRLYGSFSYKARKRVKDDLASTSIAQEAFLRLWHVREKMEDFVKVITFLKAQINEGCEAFYTKPSERFHRDLIKLDEIEGYQNFLCGYEPVEEKENSTDAQQKKIEEENKANLKIIENFLPSLSQNDQLFIDLCLKYSFCFEKISRHLGGISDVEVFKKVKKIIQNLKNAIVNADKLNITETKQNFTYQGELSDEQAQVLRLRYDLKMSFHEISLQLNLSQPQIQTIFVQAHSLAKRIKSN